MGKIKCLSCGKEQELAKFRCIFCDANLSEDEISSTKTIQIKSINFIAYLKYHSNNTPPIELIDLGYGRCVIEITIEQYREYLYGYRRSEFFLISLIHKELTQQIILKKKEFKNTLS